MNEIGISVGLVVGFFGLWVLLTGNPIPGLVVTGFGVLMFVGSARESLRLRTTKTCPACRERVKNEARRCPHCTEVIP